MMDADLDWNRSNLFNLSILHIIIIIQLSRNIVGTSQYIVVYV